MTAEQDERAFHALTQKVSAARGLRCEAYKEKCLRRRLAVRMRARGVHTFEAYGRLLDEDTSEYDRLLDALTINVTKFWRNAGTWQALSDPYLRELWRARRGDVRAWSAGCASGEEPYTVAVALAEVARALGEEAVFATAEARIDATDVDRESLERTAAAQFPDSAFAEMPADLARRYFTAVAPRRPLPVLQRLVRVRRHSGCAATTSPASRLPSLRTTSSCAATWSSTSTGRCRSACSRRSPTRSCREGSCCSARSRRCSGRRASA